MATYKQIQAHVRAHNHFVPKTCWIAHVKSDYGLIERTAPNRQNASERVELCPAAKRQAIIDALRHFGMIQEGRPSN